MTCCSSQSIWSVQAICLQYRICSCRILPHFCIDLSVYKFQFIFYHILGIFAVQVSLDAFVLYVAITLRIRNLVNWQQNFHYWRSWTWWLLHCQKSLWKLWGLSSFEIIKMEPVLGWTTLHWHRGWWEVWYWLRDTCYCKEHAQIAPPLAYRK